MLLCDVGNTNANFYDNGLITSLNIEKFKLYKPNENVYFINVNDSLKDLLDSNSLFIDLEPYFVLNTTYKGIGVDRVAACYAIKTGLIIDAGSAITMDAMSNGFHLGGIILPGISAYIDSFKKISTRLQKYPNIHVAFESLPQNTQDAMGYAMMRSITLLISELANNKQIYFTGGDGEFLARFFENGIYNKMLIFNGMIKVIDENKDKLC